MGSLILLLGSCRRGCYKGAVDFCLKVLLAIDSGYFAFVHFQEEADRNTLIKDHMRDSCVETLVDSW